MGSISEGSAQVKRYALCIPQPHLQTNAYDVMLLNIFIVESET